STNGLPQRGLAEALARLVQRQANQPVTPADFELDRVPGHLTMNFRAVDHRGKLAGSGRDLAALKKSLSGRARDSVAQQISRATPAQKIAQATGSAPQAIEQKGLTSWTFGDLPEQVDTRVAGGVVRGYPAIIDEKTSVAIRLEATAEEAAFQTQRGLA